MPKVTIYHNPRCSKSRQTLALLEERNLDIDIIEYLKDPPSVATLEKLGKAMGLEPLDFMRTKEKLFKELGLSKADKRSNKDWFQLMHDNPVLIERPIVVYEDRAVLGRPPENVLKII